jgi:hypothetical protein
VEGEVRQDDSDRPPDDVADDPRDARRSDPEESGGERPEHRGDSLALAVAAGAAAG